MRKSMVLGLLAVALGATATLAAARTGAHLAVMSTSPFTVQGSGFESHERVTVTVLTTGSRTKRVLAGTRGSFRAAFTGLSLDRCTAYVVRARGSRGTSAVLKVMPECAPEDPLFPTDPGAGKKAH